MNFSAFHLSQNVWLWSLAAIPVVALLYAVFYKPGAALGRLKLFADAHLLLHLVKNRDAIKKSVLIPLVLWSLIWACGALAMAGPRWNYTDVEANKPTRDLVILLDLSKSMDSQDVKPSRLIRAREEIEDILDMNRKLNIGLVAFAAVPHMVVPLTDDMSTIRNLLPYLDTKLIDVQGTRLKPALEMATRMLDSTPGNEKSVLVVSDGGFEDTAAARDVIAKGITVYTLGIGTAEGAPIPADDGGFIKDRSGHLVIAKLEAGKLQAIADAGHGLYVTADYTGNDTRDLLEHMESGSSAQRNAGKIVRIWDEKFWIPALAMGLLMLPMFRKGYIFPVLVFFVLTAAPLQPAHAEWTDMFRNHNQQGEEAFNKGDYGTAANIFDTPYQRGVAQYKAKQYDEAAKSFSEVKDPEQRLDAEYNLGNAQLMEKDPGAAIASYEGYLKERPNDEAAQHNLAIAKKLLEQKQKQQQEQQNGNQSQTQKNSGQSPSQPQNSQQSAGNQKPDEKNGSQQSANEPKKENNGQQQPSSGSAQNAKSKSGDNNNNRQAERQPRQSQAGQSEPQQQTQARQQQPNQPLPQSSSQASKTQTQPSKEQPEPARQQSLQNQSSQPNFSQQSPGAAQVQPQNANSPQPEEGNEYPVQNHVRTPQDVNADQWLSRAESDPGAFLKNQFLIEARKSGAQPEDEPW